MNLIKKWSGKIIAGILVASIAVVPCMSYADEQSDLEAQNDALQSQYDEEEARLAEIQSNMDDIETYISQLDEEMNVIEANISDIAYQQYEKTLTINDLNTQIAELQNNIDAQQQEINSEYELMSMRIQFMYENVGDSYIEAIFSSSSFSEAVKKVQYLLEVTEYDRKQADKIRDMVNQLNETKSQLEAQNAQVVQESTELSQLQDAQAAQESLLSQTKLLKQEEYDEAADEAYSTQAVLDEIKGQISSNQDAIDTMIAEFQAQQAAAQAAAEEAAAQAAAQAAADAAASQSSSSGSSGSSSYTVDTSQVVTGDGSYIWPLPSSYRYVTDEFGDRSWEPELAAWPEAWWHCGIDIYAPDGTPIYAVQNGVVVASYWSDYTGNTMIIYLSGGLYEEVHHMSAVAVSVGQVLTQGDTVGYVGSTGSRSTGNHLHFGLSTAPGENYVNPRYYIGY